MDKSCLFNNCYTVVMGFLQDISYVATYRVCSVCYG